MFFWNAMLIQVIYKRRSLEPVLALQQQNVFFNKNPDICFSASGRHGS
jgi:hypothetical protein